MIEVKNLTKRYGNTYAIHDINFTVNDGEIVGFLFHERRIYGIIR